MNQNKYQFIEPALRELCLSYQRTDNKKERSQLRLMINRCIRIVDVAYELTQASHEAILLAQKNNINLREMNWDNQPRFDLGRKLFVFEHKTPINMLVEKMIQNPDKILEILHDMEIVWVTRHEDNMLNSLGYRSNRQDPDQAYKEANIWIENIG